MDSAEPFSAVHRNLCPARKRNEESDFGVGLGRVRLFRRVMKQRKLN